MSRALNYIGIARKGGAIELGENSAGALVKAGKAKLLIVAQDTSEAAKRRAEGYVFASRTPLLEVPFTKAQLSQISGKSGGSMAAFRDLGLASSFADALAAEAGERYGPVAAALREKLAAAKARKRGQEKGKRG
jgi:ribosomal protein L30E